MLYWQYEKYIESLCSFGEPLPPQAAKLPRAKMEAGENPARSRHCKEEYLLNDVTGETWEGEQA